MKSALLLFFVLLEGVHFTNTANLKAEETENNSAIWTARGVWGPLLEEWALTNHRDKRVLKIPIPISQGSFSVIPDRIFLNKSPQNSDRRNDKNITDADVPKENKISLSKISSGQSHSGQVPPGKIINQSYPQNFHQKPPGRQVSETDLYLLGAIEKLVYRVDFMEKRLRRVEEMLYYVMAGNRIDQEPCPSNFTRTGPNCYFFSSNAGREMDWKAASKSCKKMGAVLAEMETIEENQDIVALIQTNSYLKGKDFWTGGLNPGLLWIWSNSARPVPTGGSSNVGGSTAGNSNAGGKPNKNQASEIRGEGRCLRLAYDPALRSYAYKGTDCGLRYSYICELPEETSSNEIRRLGRSKRIFDDL